MTGGILDPIEKPLEILVSKVTQPKKLSLVWKVVFLSFLFLCLAGVFYAVLQTLKPSSKVVKPPVYPLPTEEPITTLPAEKNVLSSAHNKFGLNILNELQKTEKGNVFISPSSIALALSMVYNGADKGTKTAMEKTLQYQGISIDEVNKMSLDLLGILKNPDPKVEINIANSIWARKGEVFNPDFLKINSRFFQAEVKNIDFNDNKSSDIINAWVNEKTKGKIPTILQPPIPGYMVMYIINAIYFKGSWTYEFDKKLTKDIQFNVFEYSGNEPAPLSFPKNTVLAMEQTRKDFSYLENDDFQAVSLPYGANKKLRMLVFLPKKTLNEFLGKLSYENWKVWAEGLGGPSFAESDSATAKSDLATAGKQEGTVVLPKFKVEYKKNLNKELKNLGMEIAFSGKADLSKIAPDLFISEVVHKTYVDVNEEGTEAAAVTAVGIGKTSFNPKEKQPFYMEVNKPFFFAIEDSSSGEVLFMGTIREIKGK